MKHLGACVESRGVGFIAHGDLPCSLAVKSDSMPEPVLIQAAKQLPAPEPLKSKLAQHVFPFLDLVLENNKTGVELLQWIYDRDILPQGPGRKEPGLRLDVKEAIEASADPYYDIIPDAAYAQSALILLVAYILDHWPDSITMFPMALGGSLNFRDAGTCTLIIDGSAQFYILNEVKPVSCEAIQLEDIAATLASFLDTELHPFLVSILAYLFAIVRSSAVATSPPPLSSPPLPHLSGV